MSDNPINELNDLYQAMKVGKPQYVEKIIDEEFEGSKFNIEVSFCDMTAMGIGLDKVSLWFGAIFLKLQIFGF